jgi:hypothetical protein
MKKRDNKNQEIRKNYMLEKQEFQEDKSKDYERILDGIHKIKERNPDYYISNLMKLLYHAKTQFYLTSNHAKTQGL